MQYDGVGVFYVQMWVLFKGLYTCVLDMTDFILLCMNY